MRIKEIIKYIILSAYEVYVGNTYAIKVLTSQLPPSVYSRHFRPCLFLFQRSLLMNLCGKRNPAANITSSSCYWSVTIRAQSLSLRWLVGSWCACLHYNISFTMPTYPSLDFLLFYYSSSNTASKTLALIPGLAHYRHTSSSCVLGFKNFYSSPSLHISHNSS